MANNCLSGLLLVAVHLFLAFTLPVEVRAAAGTPNLTADFNDNIGSAAQYIREHVWVVVLAAFGVALVVCVTVYCVCARRRASHGYMAIDGGVRGSRGFELSQSTESFGSNLQKQRQSTRAVEEESALLNCQFYLRAIGGYVMKEQLRQIGTRAGKRWYMVANQYTGQDLVMCMLGRGTTCPLTLTKTSVKTVQELMATLRHAYLLPLLHVDYLEEQDMVTFIQQFVPKGSVKDHIYNSKPLEVSHQKYQYRGRPLPEASVRTYGRHVLEAMIFLRGRGFPPCLHLHSGNVFIEGSSARLTGYELAVFGYPSRMYPLVRRAVKDDMDALEILLFGHLLYEMLVGQELNVAKAEQQHVANIRSSSLGAQVIREIFLRADGAYPSLTELRDNMFFSGGVDLSEMERLNSPPPLTGQMKSVLKLVRKGKAAPAAAPTGPTGSAKTRKRHSSSSGQKSSRPSSRGHASSTSPRPNVSPSAAATSSASASAAAAAAAPPPPPPPPAAAAPGRSSASPAPPSSAGRGGLLSQINKGTRLKKAKTNDRSAARV